MSCYRFPRADELKAARPACAVYSARYYPVGRSSVKKRTTCFKPRNVPVMRLKPQAIILFNIFLYEIYFLAFFFATRNIYVSGTFHGRKREKIWEDKEKRIELVKWPIKNMCNHFYGHMLLFWQEKKVWLTLSFWCSKNYVKNIVVLWRNL